MKNTGKAGGYSPFPCACVAEECNASASSAHVSPDVAQLAERRVHTPEVPGSSPGVSTIQQGVAKSASRQPRALESGGSIPPTLTNSTLKRGKPLVRGAPIPRASAPLSRGTRLRKVGRRGRAIRAEIDAVRQRVLERAGGRCERCGSAKGLHLHHLRSRARGGSHEASNLAALCSRPNGGCHGKAHAHLIPDWKRWIQ